MIETVSIMSYGAGLTVENSEKISATHCTELYSGGASSEILPNIIGPKMDRLLIFYLVTLTTNLFCNISRHPIPLVVEYEEITDT